MQTEFDVFNADKCPDELLHVDSNVIMTYRVVKGAGSSLTDRKTHEKDQTLRYKSILELREKNLGPNGNDGSSEAGTENEMENEPDAEIDRDSQTVEPNSQSVDDATARPSTTNHPYVQKAT